MLSACLALRVVVVVGVSFFFFFFFWWIFFSLFDFLLTGRCVRDDVARRRERNHPNPVCEHERRVSLILVFRLSYFVAHRRHTHPAGGGVSLFGLVHSLHAQFVANREHGDNCEY